jgi:quinol monooxygenase YgiN
MHARSTTIHGDPACIDDAIAYLQNKMLPELVQHEGCLGLSALTDQETGRCIVTTAWTDQAAMRATAEGIRPWRHSVERMLGSQHSDVQEWEIAVLHRDRPAGDGAAAQVTWARTAPADVDRLLGAYRTDLLPRLQELPGFCSVSVLVDRRAGRTAAVTSFESHGPQLRERARQLHSQFAQAKGSTIVDVDDMDLALAHLRVPELV